MLPFMGGFALETFDEMRLESVFGPDALHARMAHAHLFGHGAHAPLRGISTTLSLIAALIGFLPGDLERPSTRPSTPASAYFCQRQTVVLETPISRMIAMTP
jgi:hypothetical protein